MTLFAFGMCAVTADPFAMQGLTDVGPDGMLENNQNRQY
jgi:hypothetical protein